MQLRFAIPNQNKSNAGIPNIILGHKQMNKPAAQSHNVSYTYQKGTPYQHQAIHDVNTEFEQGKYSHRWTNG